MSSLICLIPPLRQNSLDSIRGANSILPFRSIPEGQIRYLAVLKANTGIDENNPEVARILEIDRNYGPERVLLRS